MTKKILSAALTLIIILGISALPAFAAATFSIDKTNYAPKETITSTVNGVTEEMVKAGAFISIYKAGAAHSAWGAYKYTTLVGTNVLTIAAPTAEGSYEMRLYNKNRQYDDTTFVTMVAFTAGSASSVVTTAPPTTTAPPATTTPEPTPTSTPPSGNNKSTLAGWKWVCMMPRQIQKQVRMEMTFVVEMVTDSYMFFNDGAFMYFPYNERFAYYKGTYTVSNAKLYLDSITRRNRETEEVLTNLTVSGKIEIEYEILTDKDGEYLHIGSLAAFRDVPTVDISQANIYRKGESIE